MGDLSHRHVVLLGLMGSGKTSVGERVAARLGRQLVDGDVVLAGRTGGRTAAQVADADGIEALHELEAGIALDAVADPTPAVLGPAASTIEVDACLTAYAGHDVVWFTAPAAWLAERAVQKDHRPLLDDGDPVALFEAQLAVREPRARSIAGLVVDRSTTSKEEAADRICAYVAQQATLRTAGPSSSPPTSSSPPS